MGGDTVIAHKMGCTQNIYALEKINVFIYLLYAYGLLCPGTLEIQKNVA